MPTFAEENTCSLKFIEYTKTYKNIYNVLVISISTNRATKILAVTLL